MMLIQSGPKVKCTVIKSKVYCFHVGTFKFQEC